MNQLDLNFIEAAKKEHPVFFYRNKVLEIGAQDVNGNVRGPFVECEFTGIDWIAGKNVDIVVPAKDTEFPDKSFHVLLTVNQLEHDPDWKESIGHNLPALKRGSLLLMRWAGPGSAAHGPEFDPHGKLGYYPKSREEVVAWLEENGCHVVKQYGDQNPYIGPMVNVIAKKL